MLFAAIYLKKINQVYLGTSLRVQYSPTLKTEDSIEPRKL